jgi:glucose-6-phosphate 1-dehydrogenase
LVVFGASGDLTHRKIVPAVYNLFHDGLWPANALLVGYARSDKSDQSFREGLRESVAEHSRRPLDEQRWGQFAANVFYHRGDYDSGADFTALRQRLESLTAAAGIPANYLFYLSTPPGQFIGVVEQLGLSGLARRGAVSGPDLWSRVVIEKPFGRDLASAQELNRTLWKILDEKQIYRIDHYLGKETVQNLLVMRFANSIFEPIWNQKYIDHVQITVSETLGVAGRGSYYDQAGTLRDMLQNHMMNLLCLVALEAPTFLSADSIRNEKVKVLQALRPIPADCAAVGVVRAQYGAGRVDDEPIAAYLDEPGVAPQSTTETFMALKTYVDNWRWAGVPFYLRSGKALGQRVTEIVVQFKAIPQILFNAPPARPLQPNSLVIRVQPDEGISMQLQVKQPGAPLQIEPYPMHFGYAGAFGRSVPEAYERLILDAATGDSTLFIRSDEIEAAWRFVTPILEGCDLRPCTKLSTYVPGSWGPPAADELIAAEGHRWHEPTPMGPPSESPET